MKICMKRNRGITEGNIKNVRPFIWSLVIYLLLIPLDAFKIFESFSFMKLLALTPIVLSLFHFREELLKISYRSASLIIYLLIVAISVFYSIDINQSANTAESIILNAGVILVLSMFYVYENEYNLLKKAMFYSSWFAAALMIYNGLSSGTEFARLSISDGTTSQDPNYICGYLLFAVALHLHNVMNDKKRILNLSCIMFLLTLVFMTGSRGGLLAFFATIAFVIFIEVSKKQNKFNIIFIFCFVGFAILCCIPYIIDFLPESLSSRFSLAAVLADKGTGRMILWENVVDAFLGSSFIRMLFGYGIGSSIHFTYSNLLVHNLWLEYLIGLGLIGMCISLYIHVKLIIDSWNYDERVIFGTIMGYMMMTMSLSLLAYKPLWSVILIILLMKRRKKYSN